jgi:lipid-binding SYLF domain-containing protein
MAMLNRRGALEFLSLGALAALALPEHAEADAAVDIDAGVDRTVRVFTGRIRGARELLDKAAAVLVFPSVFKAGVGVGGEYGEGALLIGGRNAGYFNTVSASIGFQLGAQARSIVIAFMTHEALQRFRRVAGFKIGVDGSVAIVNLGVGGSIDTSKITNPIVGFIFDGKGLMYNLTLEGSKISRIKR